MIRAGYSASESPLDSVQFRQVSETDLPFLCELYGTTRADELARVDWTNDQKQQFITMQFEAQHSHYQNYFPDADYLIVCQGDHPIGRLYIDRRESEIRLIDIALIPDVRSQGLGGAMLQTLIEEARQSEKSLSIHVEKNNPAMALYLRLGFVKIEDQGVYDLMAWSV